MIRLILIAAVILILCSSFFLFHKSISEPSKKEAVEAEEIPEDYFSMRAYPDPYVDMKAYDAAIKDAMNKKNISRTGDSWTVEGPGNIGGRINCMAIDPANPKIIYEGNATGGIFKTTDGGETWNSVFDQQPYLSIGTITIDPNDPQTIWVGTGDVNISAYVFVGDGVYRSKDGGASWTHMGLSETKITSKIIVDPSNSNIIYTATMGLPFDTTHDRGLYKSTDGGITWKNILFVDVDAGIIDMVMDPDSSSTLYAASWNRLRNNHQSIVSGHDAHIYKTTDGGAHWTVLKNGLPQTSLCRIGLAISKQNHKKLYAAIVDTAEYAIQGIYKSEDGGENWTDATGNFDSETYGTQGWYFGKIYVNPTNDEQVFVPGVNLQTSFDGGHTWRQATPDWSLFEVHADGHAMDFESENTFYYCTDGGMYKTTDNCNTWTDAENIPNTQFYHVTYNPYDPENYFGGAQDNGTTGGSSSYINEWPRIFGGDGFKPLFSAEDPNTHYVETQYGGIWATIDNGQTYFGLVNGIDLAERRGWNMPYIMNAHVSSLLYCGTYRMYKMQDAPNGTWQNIGPDLTGGISDQFHVITTIDQSSLNDNFLYAGTSDGKVWATPDGGNTWNETDNTLPNRYVTSVHASPNTASIVYVTHSGYRDNDYIPHVHKSIDNGNTWTDISGNMPQLAVNDLLVAPGNEDHIFIATDAGVYVTQNGGINWTRYGDNMPFIPVYELELNTYNNRLIAGTFARGIWTIASGINVGVPGINNISKNISLYPNPTSDVLHLQYKSQNQKIALTIYDASGKQILNEITGANSDISIPVNNFAEGIYYILLKDGNETGMKKFMKADNF